MTVDEQKTLFTRFTQGSAKTHTQYGGSGLGLYICRALVEIHGGQIGFSSMPGVGSTFGFFIKTRRLSIPEVARKSSEASSLSLILSKDAKLDIMIVEDNLINQKVLSRQLIRLGHSVTLANHGMECVELLRRSRFCNEAGQGLSVILMDIEMPVMDGMACAREIRKMQEDGLVRGHVPIIAITGNARDEKVQQAKSAGMVSLLIPNSGIQYRSHSYL
jgi:CheY-like chemotaxis protein